VPCLARRPPGVADGPAVAAPQVALAEDPHHPRDLGHAPILRYVAEVLDPVEVGTRQQVTRSAPAAERPPLT
jgi:hypothetical protein